MIVFSLIRVRELVCPFLILVFSFSLIFTAKSDAKAITPPTIHELIIVTEEYPPLSFTNEKGEPDGLVTDVVKEIMHRLQMTQEIHVWPWARGYNFTKEGPNYVLFSVAYTNFRKPLFQWVGCLLRTYPGLYAKKGRYQPIESLSDAKVFGSIGVHRDSVNHQILDQAGFQNLVPVTSNTQNIRKLMANRLDLIAATNITLPDFARKAGYEAEDMTLIYPFAVTDAYIAFSNQVPEEIVQTWQTTFDDIREDGTMDNILHKWGITSEQLKNSVNCH